MLPPGPTPSLLVVEDSDEDFETVEEAVRSAGLGASPHRLMSGDALLQWLDTTFVHHPMIVLMDLNTPGIDGREALRELKADRRWRSIPVIVMSTSANPRDVEACYAAGANAYHVKPLRYVDHLTLVTGVLKYWLQQVVPSTLTAATP